MYRIQAKGLGTMFGTVLVKFYGRFLFGASALSHSIAWAHSLSIPATLSLSLSFASSLASCTHTHIYFIGEIFRIDIVCGVFVCLGYNDMGERQYRGLIQK